MSYVTVDLFREAKANWGKLKMSLRWYKKHTKVLMEQNAQLLEERKQSKDNFEFYNEKVTVNFV